MVKINGCDDCNPRMCALGCEWKEEALLKFNEEEYIIKPKPRRQNPYRRYQIRQLFTEIELKQCNNCHSPKHIHIHHKDRNPRNNNRENLEVLCCECHQIRHPGIPVCSICSTH